MGLNVALMTPRSSAETTPVAAACARHDVPLHLIGPLGFGAQAASAEWEGCDWWEHENWFRFRDAISRERCLYLGTNGEVALGEVEVAWNAVLVVPSDGALPDRILEKHPEQCVRVPAGSDAGAAVQWALEQVRARKGRRA